MVMQQSTIKTELLMQFRTLTGEAVPATLKRIEFQYENEQHDEARPCDCKLTFEVSGTVCQDILQGEWFHLFKSMRLDSTTFELNQPVEIRATLRTDLTRKLADQELDAEAIFNAMLPNATVEIGLVQYALKNTESWMALELRQGVSLPDELASEGGSLVTRLKTRWADQDQEVSVNSDLRSQIEQYLQSKSLQFEAVDERLLKLRFHNQLTSWNSLLRLDDAGQYCAVYSVFPALVSAELREETALAFISENYDLVQGSFEMDDEDGELRFRTTIFINKQLDTAILGSVLAEHLRVMEHYIPLLR